MRQQNTVDTHSAHGALHGYRVLDLTDEKGLLCGKLLADMGADVIKIEPLGGDPSRKIGPFYHDIPDPEKSLFWFAFNTNKRSITLNIEAADGKELFKRLIGNTDFVIESFAPRYMQRLGLGYSALSKINPGIIVTSITPFGQTGPYRNHKSSDITLMAMGGFMDGHGDPDRPPLRISLEQSYVLAGVAAASACGLALYHRELTGKGQHIDVSIQECIAWLPQWTMPRWFVNRELFKRAGVYRHHKHASLRMLYPCKDGYISFWIGMAKLAGPSEISLIRAMEKDGLGHELKNVDWVSLGFDDITQEDHDRWEKIHIDYFMKHTKAELLTLLKEEGVLLSPVNNPKDLLEDEQLEARGFWEKVEHPELKDSITYPGAFFKSTETPCSIRRRAPLIGEHNEEIYHDELGLSRDTMILLKEAGII